MLISCIVDMVTETDIFDEPESHLAKTMTVFSICAKEYFNWYSYVFWVFERVHTILNSDWVNRSYAWLVQLPFCMRRNTSHCHELTVVWNGWEKWVSACWGQGLAVQWQVAVSDGTLAHFCSSYTGNVFLINCVCRCWNQHLSQCMKQLRETLRNKCDQYFDEIQPQAVKVR